jgi:hypothetical protein
MGKALRLIQIPMHSNQDEKYLNARHLRFL